MNIFRPAFKTLSGLSLVSLLFFLQSHAASVAQWRFETGPANTDVLHAGTDGVFSGTTPDSSGNGNSLSAWTQGGYGGFSYRTNVPFVSMPSSGVTNKFSVKNSGSYPAFFTSAAGSAPSGINAQTITPAQFTIEVSYKPEATASYRTIVGRDARTVSTADANLAALYLQARPDDSVGILFTDVSGYTYSAYSPPGWLYGFYSSTNSEGTGVPWYHLAATSDGATLKMYVNSYLVATTDISTNASANRALAKGAASGADWTAGAWSVGRGLYAGAHADRAYGFIDEVRISNTALTPGEFLATTAPRLINAKILNGNFTFTATNGQPGATCYLLQSTNLSLRFTQWTSLLTKTFSTNGTFSHLTPLSDTTAGNFFSLNQIIGATPPGAMTYELAGNSATWPANIRAQIIYAMDGAVAQYNRYGTFNKHLYVNYNPAVPTAQGSYNGTIDFGGQIGYRTALHEIAHTLGVGTVANWSANLQSGIWTGANAIQQLRAFDGPTADVHSDGTHFWPYGLNYDNEGNTENFRRHVLMLAALRKDMGLQ